MRGRTLKISAPRRLVCDLMRFSVGIPRITVQRQMNLAPLLEARMEQPIRLSWTVLFLKGYGLLAQEVPELRRAYLKFPWPRIYEYPMSVASVAHEREFDGERVVLLGTIRGPERREIVDLQAMMETARTQPVLGIKEFRRALKFARLPAPMRWMLMWLGLNIAGRRARHFGTFQLSVYSGLGAESLNPLTPLTTLLNWGPISEDGVVNVRILYDHRVMDGATVARALVRFEEILNGKVASEANSLASQETIGAHSTARTKV
ncbi:hypothetical protein [Sinorhizobium sp. BG8]|uniref:hypothetical protein n=1 Tax=Sinorhizobium sp. BG8 TaxID=2613773 RepID=UPI00193D6304|nr:hypothetical protein [Sinorhizobium sp. BG8]QRM57209.1 hypothetical protein F3Y30_22090 [Sinorhizobium sp. BG8]